MRALRDRTTKAQVTEAKMKHAGPIHVPITTIRDDTQLRCFLRKAWPERMEALWAEYAIAPGNWVELAWSLAIDLHPAFRLHPPKRKPGRKKRPRKPVGRPISWSPDVRRGLKTIVDAGRAETMAARGRRAGNKEVIRRWLATQNLFQSQHDLDKAASRFAKELSPSRKKRRKTTAK